MISPVGESDETASADEEKMYVEDVAEAAVSELSSSEHIDELCSGRSGTDEGIDTAGEFAVTGLGAVVIVIAVVLVGSSYSEGVSAAAEHSEAGCWTTIVTVVVKVDLRKPG